MAVNNIAESRVGGLGGSDAAMVRKAATSLLTDTDIKRLKIFAISLSQKVKAIVTNKHLRL